MPILSRYCRIVGVLAVLFWTLVMVAVSDSGNANDTWVPANSEVVLTSNWTHATCVIAPENQDPPVTVQFPRPPTFRHTLLHGGVGPEVRVTPTWTGGAYATCDPGNGMLITGLVTAVLPWGRSYYLPVLGGLLYTFGARKRLWLAQRRRLAWNERGVNR